MTAARFHLSREQLFDASGNPLAGGRLYFYVTGTTTPQDTYSNPGLTATNTNPVVADSAGRVGDVFLLNRIYRVQLRDSADTLIWDADNVYKDVTFVSNAGLPAAAFPGMLVHNTSDAKRWRRNSTNSAWIDEGPIDAVGNTAGVSDVVTGTSSSLFATPDAIAGLWERQPDIASASVLTLSAGGYYEVTGTTTITGINAQRAGLEVELRFQSSLQLTHGASFALVGGANITVQAGDVARFRNVSAAGTSGTSWRMTSFTPALALAATLPQASAKTSSYTVTDADRGSLIRFSGLSAAATLSLPAAAGRSGFLLYVVNDDTTEATPYAVIVDPSGAEQIDGQATRQGHFGTRVTLLCDGTGWRTVAGNWRYTTGDQSWPAAQALSTNFSHGLGVRPKNVWSELRCTTADNGYAVGDCICGPSVAESDGATTRGLTIFFDATNIRFAVPNTQSIWTTPKGGGANVQLTAGSWRYRLYAED